MEISHMSHSTDLQPLVLSGLAHRCASETERYFARQAYDPRYCFELFRRAILHRDPRAWEHLYSQYRPLVAGWVRRHPAFSSTDEEAQYFVNRAFEKMWLALTPGRFHRFPDLKSLLRYLQMCVHSTVLDVVRANECPVADTPVETLAAGGSSDEPAVEHAALARIRRQEFWREIEARLRSDQERRVVYGSFVLALKPSELYNQYPGTFRDVNHVYRVKENVLARLRRDSALEELFGQDI
jgi:DNA-directed RNA polymerase specialized sigma24 family protein